MTNGQMNSVLREVRKMALRGERLGLSDGELVGRYLTSRDEAAFETLLHRHGSMVLAACRRILGNQHDAEDAFQATFLVLARKASSIVPREMVGNWLYGVACRAAMKAKTIAAKRRAKEQQAASTAQKRVEPNQWSDVEAVHQELTRLPDIYRAAVVLCDLEGKTHQEAARQLRCPVGTVSTRLQRARALLARRLTRRGVTLSGAGLVMLLGDDSARATVSASLLSSTCKAAMLFTGSTALAGATSTAVATLTQVVLKAMLVSKLNTVTALILVAISLTGTIAVFSQQTTASERPTDQRAQDQRAKEQGPPKTVTYAIADLVGKDTDSDNIIKMLTTTIDPQSWATKGGAGTADYFPLGKSLVITQTTDRHKQIGELLASLRKMNEFEKVRDTWVSVYWEEGGHQASKEETDDYRFIFGSRPITPSVSADGVTIENGRSRKAGAWAKHSVTCQCSFDPTADPKSIDFTVLGKSMPGIYEFDGDTLKICFGRAGDRRPTRFATSEKNGYRFVVLKRVAPAAATNQETIKGKWTLVRIEEGAKKKGGTGSVQLIVTNEHLIWQERGQDRVMKYKLDDKPTKRSITLLSLVEGDGFGDVCLGIYEVKGDTLRIVEGPWLSDPKALSRFRGKINPNDTWHFPEKRDESKRPGEFSTKPGSENVLFVWKRAGASSAGTSTNVTVEETHTGSLIFGVGVNSNSGLNGAIPAPSADFPEGREHNLGKVARGTQAKCSFPIVNTTNGPLAIRNIRYSNGSVQAAASKSPLQPKEKCWLEVTIDTKRFVGPKTMSVYLEIQEGGKTKEVVFTVTVESKE